MQWTDGSHAETDGVRVDVRSIYLEDRSSPAQHHWMYAYEVTITNTGDTPVQLRSRHWIITNAHGVQDHVRGAGVVGEQPHLLPGQSYQYTSGCPLSTELGTMHGSYKMERPDGSVFDAEVAPFTLTPPYALN